MYCRDANARKRAQAGFPSSPIIKLQAIPAWGYGGAFPIRKLAAPHYLVGTLSLERQPRRPSLQTRAQLFSLVLLLLFAITTTFAQRTTVKRSVILRRDSSTASQALEHLKSGATVTLLDTARQNGFYHVRTEDGQEGWVWARNISVQSTPPQSSSAAPSTSGIATQCDDSLWNHVYHPQRLIVKQQCIAVTGTLVDATNGQRADGVRHEADGDTHGWLDVDPQFKSLLNAGNLSSEGGNLVFEIVCKFHVTQADAKPACPSTYASRVQIPMVGSHVRIVGSYVQDTNHAKWMEIHPVTSITVTP
jgi:hypothetical protein